MPCQNRWHAWWTLSYCKVYMHTLREWMKQQNLFSLITFITNLKHDSCHKIYPHVLIFRYLLGNQIISFETMSTEEKAMPFQLCKSMKMIPSLFTTLLETINLVISCMFVGNCTFLSLWHISGRIKKTYKGRMCIWIN